VGKKMAVGKEGDIYVVKDEAGDSRVLKMHRYVASLRHCTKGSLGERMGSS
jgi:RIO-like serine/threonine protein kinase